MTKLVELFRTTCPVQASFCRARLEAAGIEAILFDQGIASLHGGIGALPVRIVVAERHEARAAMILAELGFADPARPSHG